MKKIMRPKSPVRHNCAYAGRLLLFQIGPKRRKVGPAATISKYSVKHASADLCVQTIATR